MTDATLFAHSLPTGADTSRWEPLADHLERVGRRASSLAEVFGTGKLALAAGLLHDLGKYSLDFQSYIRGARAKGPDHSTAGAAAAAMLYGRHIGRVLAFAVAGHHSGLMDGSGHASRGRSLEDRLASGASNPPDDDWRRHVPGLPTLDELRATSPPEAHSDYPGFEVAFLVRMIFSCLVDADFLETEAFYAAADGRSAPARGGSVTQTHLDRIRAHRASHRRADTPVNRLRSEVLDHAVSKAALAPGLFTLTVPTGGGKTLTSLSFALEHALAHGLRRIVYVIPYTSIIEQTAKVFRKEVGLGDAVLEHHSAFDWDDRQMSAADEAWEAAHGMAKLRRDVENWDAPIVVTTAVQFFESLYAARTSQARKLHNLAKSVVILDEAQTLPVKLLRPCMAALDELARNYGASVVLCTATQPALRKQDGALPPRTKQAGPTGFDIGDDRELAPRPRDLYGALKRVEVEWRDPVDDVEIVDRFRAQDRMLCIVNTRAHARALFEAIAHLTGARHLTTLMYPRHRREVLEVVKDDLQHRRPVRLVATSLIEAGVDVDFPEVWRAAAGLDSIAQAAGRCNREGTLAGPGRTVVFQPAQRKAPPAIEAFYQAARPVLRGVGDPLRMEAIHQYFRELYFLRGDAALDAATLDRKPYPILAQISDTWREVNFPFSRIAQAFRVIDEAMKPVIIPGRLGCPRDEDAKVALDALRYAPKPPKDVLRRLQQYVVPVPRTPLAALLSSGAVQAIAPNIYGDRFLYLASDSLYDDACGLRLDDPAWRASEENLW